MVSVASEVSAGIKLSITCTHLNCQLYLMHTHDVSADAKSGKGLLKLVTEDIQWSQDKFSLNIITVCSDNGSDAQKMRRLLLALVPWFIILVCWAHQINLIVGDYIGLPTLWGYFVESSYKHSTRFSPSSCQSSYAGQHIISHSAGFSKFKFP